MRGAKARIAEELATIAAAVAATMVATTAAVKAATICVDAFQLPPI